jgi:hypothetical protein
MRHISLLLIRDLISNLGRTARAPSVGFAREVESPILSTNERLAQINGIVDDDDVHQVIAVTDKPFGHRRAIAGRHAVAHDPAHLDMRCCHDQCVSFPFAR